MPSGTLGPDHRLQLMMTRGCLQKGAAPFFLLITGIPEILTKQFCRSTKFHRGLRSPAFREGWGRHAIRNASHARDSPSSSRVRLAAEAGSAFAMCVLSRGLRPVDQTTQGRTQSGLKDRVGPLISRTRKYRPSILSAAPMNQPGQKRGKQERGHPFWDGPSPCGSDPCRVPFLPAMAASRRREGESARRLTGSR